MNEALLSDVIDHVRAVRLIVYDGNGADAAEALRAVRARFEVHVSPRLVGELQLSAGLLNQLYGEWNQAQDHFRRAEVMARFAGDLDLLGHALAWTAHCQFNIGKPVDAAEAISLLFKEVSHLSEGSNEFRHRFCQVVGELFAFAGDLSVARRWFDVARGLAGLIKSRGLFSATIYTQTAMRVWSSAILVRLEGRAIDSGGMSEDINAVKSLENYDSLTGVVNRPQLRSMLLAQVYGTYRRHDDAITVLNRLLSNPSDLSGLDLCRARLERAWNLASVADSLDLSGNDPLGLWGCFDYLLDDDDLALAHDLASKLSGASDKNDAKVKHVQSANHYRAQFRHHQKLVMGCLLGIDLPDPADLAVRHK